MDAKLEQQLRRILGSTGVQDSDYTNADWWVREASEYGPSVMLKALLLREAWRSIVPASSDDWLGQMIAELRRRKGDGDDSYTARMARQHPKLLETMAGLATSEESAQALTMLVRSAQIQVLSSLIGLIDGGFTFEDGLAADWALVATDEDGEPSQMIGHLSDHLWMFDPARRD